MAGYRRGIRLPGAVVVVAGPAGPVGRATAAALAGAGARPVLLDQGVADAVRDTARRVVRDYGRLDGWVQCTGTASCGGLLDLPLDEVRRVLDADLMGAVHGARAALPQMARQGRGVLVVVASVHAQVARPFGAPQGMAGAAVRVLAAALRQELRLGGVRGVAVTTVLAPRVGDDGAEPAFPATSAERVAATVLGQLRHPRLEKVAGGPSAKALVHGHALVPGVTEWLVAQRSRRRAPDQRTHDGGTADGG